MVDKEKRELSIGELAQLSGLKSSAIRYYETLGLLQSRRTHGSQRRYAESSVLILRGVGVAKSAGFTLQEIGELWNQVRDEEPLSSRWEQLAEQKLVELDLLIGQAQEMKKVLLHGIECRCTTLEDCPCVVAS